MKIKVCKVSDSVAACEQVYDLVHTSVRDSVYDSVCVSVHNSVFNSVCVSVGDSVRASVFPSVHHDSVVIKPKNHDMLRGVLWKQHFLIQFIIQFVI